MRRDRHGPRPQQRLLVATARRLHERAARVEAGARPAGSRGSADRPARESRVCSAPPPVGDRNRREQRQRVRVERVVVQVVGRRDLDDLAEVHHRDPVGDMPDDGQVVGDEEVGGAEFLLEVLEEVPTICAWMDTSRAETGSSQTTSDGLSESARARPTLCRWPPENWCGVPVSGVRRQPHDLEDLPNRALASPPFAIPCTRSSSRSSGRPSGAGSATQRVLEHRLHAPSRRT